MRYMEMIAHGGKPKSGGGPSPKVAKEYVAATPTTKGLPERKSKKVS
jgi:hypothetical protein